jgi:hypothetical protein
MALEAAFISKALVVARHLVADIWTNVLVVMFPTSHVSMNVPFPAKAELLHGGIGEERVL